MVRKTRQGIGYMGRVFQYGTAMANGGAALRFNGPPPEQEENVKKLNKIPEFKRAAKKRARREDFKQGGFNE